MGKLQKLDNRVQVMLQDGVKQNYRTLLIFVGNKGQDQIPILHQIQSAVTKKGMLKLLWCYKKELSFSTKRRKAGIVSEGTVFEQFICSTDIRWCYYHETQKILGQTFDMCILQDFEALTPNTLARTIETVSGGGLVVFLLKSMDSLRQICTMAMDVHARYRTEANADVVCRFNERFLLSLAHNPRCIVLDDKWNILPISKKVIASLNSVPDSTQLEYISREQEELAKLKLILSEDGSYFSVLVNLCKTLDQAKSLLQFCSAIIDITKPSNRYQAKAHESEKLKQFDLSTQSLVRALSRDDSISKSLPTASSAVVTVTAARGRGKSAALGLGLAAAFDSGLPNLCVTAPSPENLLTLMQFVLLGLKALKYEEHVDYTVFRSTDAEYNKSVVRIEVTRRSYRQTLLYLAPWDTTNLTTASNWQPDLFCIDEAAAIPLPSVRQMITGPKLVFMASTVNGYEGTGRSLSVKLIHQLRQECYRVGEANTTTANKSRLLYEVSLQEAIRYANGDAIERWLNDLLCLDCGEKLSEKSEGKVGTCPPPDLCQLYYVNRDTLFAYHTSTEIFLQRLMSLYVSSHYKNSPNDLQLLSDAPAHHIFCLLAPYDPSSGRVPEILCVLQVCLEGKINKEIVLRSLSRGLKPCGDLIPWTISQQFCEPNFGELSGARVIRIATHPDYQGLGYGSRALKLLYDYYLGKIPLQIARDVETDTSLSATKLEELRKSDSSAPNSAEDEIDEESCEEESEVDEEIPDNLSDEEDEDDKGPASKKAKQVATTVEKTMGSNLLNEHVNCRRSTSLPPLLSRLSERKPEKLNYIGVSFGATPKLIRFWKKAGYLPVYLRQTMNDLTGEFSCIMLCELHHDGGTCIDVDWLKEFFFDFCKRFIKLLPGPFRNLDAAYCLELLTAKSMRSWVPEAAGRGEFRNLFSDLEIERMHRYLRSLLDFPMVADQLPELASLFFLKRFPTVKLNKTQQVILVGLGLQRKSADELGRELENLLGTDGVPSISRIRSDEGAVWKSCHAGAPYRDKQKKINMTDVPEDETGQLATSGWARRIRGLLFVAIRELVRCLDEAIKEEGVQPNTQLKSLLKKDASNTSLATGKPITTPLVEQMPETNMIKSNGSAEEDDTDEGDNDIDERDDDIDATSSAPEDAAEQQRRSALVKQMLLDEGDATLAQYAVKGSDSSWQSAVAGHGSDLSSLRIRVSTDGNNASGKRLREPVGDRLERRQRVRLGISEGGAANFPNRGNRKQKKQKQKQFHRK